jgi:hypothetical protein
VLPSRAEEIRDEALAAGRKGMSKSRVGRKGGTALVRRDPEREGSQASAVDDLGPSSGGRVLQHALQRGQGEDLRAVALALTTFRNLTQLSSGDALALSVIQAAREVGMSEKEAWAHLKKLIPYAGSAYPKGFL